jgi:hypothetical protein
MHGYPVASVKITSKTLDLLCIASYNILNKSIGGAMLKQLIDWFTRPQITEIEQYISSQNPKTTADVEQLINEFNYKRKLQCF